MDRLTSPSKRWGIRLLVWPVKDKRKLEPKGFVAQILVIMLKPILWVLQPLARPLFVWLYWRYEGLHTDGKKLYVNNFLEPADLTSLIVMLASNDWLERWEHSLGGLDQASWKENPGIFGNQVSLTAGTSTSPKPTVSQSLNEIKGLVAEWVTYFKSNQPPSPGSVAWYAKAAEDNSLIHARAEYEARVEIEKQRLLEQWSQKDES